MTLLGCCGYTDKKKKLDEGRNSESKGRIFQPKYPAMEQVDHGASSEVARTQATPLQGLTQSFTIRPRTFSVLSQPNHNPEWAGLKPKKVTWGGASDVVAKATRNLGPGVARGSAVNEQMGAEALHKLHSTSVAFDH